MVVGGWHIQKSIWTWYSYLEQLGILRSLRHVFNSMVPLENPRMSILYSLSLISVVKSVYLVETDFENGARNSSESPKSSKVWAKEILKLILKKRI